MRTLLLGTAAVGAALFAGIQIGRAAPAGIPSSCVSWGEARPIAQGEWGELRLHFAGETFGTTSTFAGVAELAPGGSVHPAHRHAEEEYLVLLDGEGTWHLDGKELPAKAGDMVYIDPWVWHGVTNTSDKPLKFAVVKYTGKGVTPPPAPEGPHELPAKP